MSFEFALQENLFHLSSLLMIENKNPYTGITLYAQSTLKMVTNNIWFYLGIALVCFLLLSVIILTGIAFYWSLKIKKTQKEYEQFKLTAES